MEYELTDNHIKFEDAKAEISMEPMDIKPSLDEDNKMILKPDSGEILSSQGDRVLEPHEGMEFESEEAVKTFYSMYARHVGFRIRISRYTRAKHDNSIVSRRIVCSKEGFCELRANESLFGEQIQQQRARTRVGCKAMILVKKIETGKWIITKFIKEHNHGPVPPRKVKNRTVRRNDDLVEKRYITEGDSVQEPFEGMEFESEEAAKLFYISYARNMGFRARISRYCRSRRDNSIISRQIVCSKEGFREVRVKKEKETTDVGKIKRPRMITRIGCKAMIVVKKMSGKWVVTKFQKEHNHALISAKKVPCLQSHSSTGKICNSQGVTMVPNGTVIDACPNGTRGTSQESLTILYNQLCYEAIKYAQVGATTEHSYNVAMAALKEAAEKVAAAKRSAGLEAQPGLAIGGTRQAFLVATGSSVSSLVQIKSLDDLKSQDNIEQATAALESKPQQQPVHFVLLPSSFLTDSKASTCSVEAPLIFNVAADSLHAALSNQTMNIADPVTVQNHSCITMLSTEGSAGKGPEGSDLATREKMKLQTLDTVPEIVEAHKKTQKLETNGVRLASATQSTVKKISVASSDAKPVGIPAFPVTVYMPVLGSLPATCAGTPGTYDLLAAPIESPPVSARPAESSTQSQDTTRQLARSASKSGTLALVPSQGTPSDRKPQRSPNPQVHATAIACGARVVSPMAAASLIKAIEARTRSSGASITTATTACGFGSLDSELSPEPCNDEEGKTQHNPVNIVSQGLEESSKEMKDDKSAEAMELEVEAGHALVGADEQEQPIFVRQIGLLDPIGAADDMTIF